MLIGFARELNKCQVGRVVYHRLIREIIMRLPNTLKFSPIASLYATGPPTDFEEAERGIDLTTNRGYAIFRWKAPYDIDPNADLAEFFINSGGNGNQELV